MGTVVGSATPQMFRVAAAPGGMTLHDIVAVDDEQGQPVWARVVEIERLNPLFPTEAAQELAFQSMDAFDSVASLSRELVTAKCRVLGTATSGGRLQPLSYPVRPASQVYIPDSDDVAELLAGGIPEQRRIRLGSLRAQPEVPVFVDAHAVVARHLAVLAATGGGKTVATRKVIEGLASLGRGYPMLLLDPHGDYLGLQELWPDRVQLFLADIDFSQESRGAVIELVSSLSGEEVTGPQVGLLETALQWQRSDEVRQRLEEWCAEHNLPRPTRNADTLQELIFFVRWLSRYGQERGLQRTLDTDKVNESVPGPLLRKLRRVQSALQDMRRMSQARAKGLDAAPLPAGAAMQALIRPGMISIISLEGYSDTMRQSIAASVLQKLLGLRIDGKVDPFLTVVEEAHNFAPPRGESEGVPSLPVLKRIASEGRKFGMGLVFVTQRPSRLDSTVLSQCNSFMILRIVNPADQQYIREVVETIGAEDAALLPSLGVGEALLSGQFVGTPVLAKVEPGRATSAREEDDLIGRLYE